MTSYQPPTGLASQLSGSSARRLPGLAVDRPSRPCGLLSTGPWFQLGVTHTRIGASHNQLHGVRATGDRLRRLKVLYRISEHSPNLQLINDVAAYWWMAVLLDPSRLARSGTAP